MSFLSFMNLSEIISLWIHRIFRCAKMTFQLDAWVVGPWLKVDQLILFHKRNLEAHSLPCFCKHCSVKESYVETGLASFCGTSISVEIWNFLFFHIIFQLGIILPDSLRCALLCLSPLVSARYLNWACCRLQIDISFVRFVSNDLILIKLKRTATLSP